MRGLAFAAPTPCLSASILALIGFVGFGAMSGSEEGYTPSDDSYQPKVETPAATAPDRNDSPGIQGVGGVDLGNYGLSYESNSQREEPGFYDNRPNDLGQTWDN